MSKPRTQLLLIVACVVASITVSDLASSRAWLAGGHVTPEQWALHEQYQALGVHHHHGEVDAEAPEATTAGTALASFDLAWANRLPSGAADPGSLARNVGGVDAVVPTDSTAITRLRLEAVARPTSLDSLVADPPPRHTV